MLQACIQFQADYLKELIDLTDYPTFQVQEVVERFHEWEQHKDEGIMTFRDHNYRSVITGDLAPLLVDRNGERVLWKDAMSETCESFGMWDMFKGNTRVAGGAGAVGEAGAGAGLRK